MLQWVATLVLVSSIVPAVPCSRETAPAMEHTLFGLNTLLYAATSVAGPAERQQLHTYLLAAMPDANIDAAYPIRGRVHHAVQQWPLALRQRALVFLLAHPVAVTNLNALVLQMVGPPPSYDVRHDGVPGGPMEQHLYADRQILSQILQDLDRAGGHALLQQSESLWVQSQFCVRELDGLQRRLSGYMGTPLPSYRPLVLSNPLMPAESGVTTVYTDGRALSIIGPTLTGNERDILVLHELAHPMVNQLFKNDLNLRHALDQSICVMEQIQHKRTMKALTVAVYGSWVNYYGESLVRIVSHQLGHAQDRSGLIMPSFQGTLLAYEHGQSSFASYAERTLFDLRRHYCGNAGSLEISSHVNAGGNGVPHS